MTDEQLGHRAIAHRERTQNGASTMIGEFQGEYRFLSNFWPAKTFYAGQMYPTAEHAYQAAKTHDAAAAERIRLARTPGEAKRLGRTVPVRPDWMSVRVQIMRQIVRAKFIGNPDLLCDLLATGAAELREGNRWGDTFWGVCNGRGQNHLGKILMELRKELRG